MPAQIEIANQTTDPSPITTFSVHYTVFQRRLETADRYGELYANRHALAQKHYNAAKLIIEKSQRTAEDLARLAALNVFIAASNILMHQISDLGQTLTNYNNAYAPYCSPNSPAYLTPSDETINRRDDFEIAVANFYKASQITAAAFLERNCSDATVEDIELLNTAVRDVNAVYRNPQNQIAIIILNDTHQTLPQAWQSRYLAGLLSHILAAALLTNVILLSLFILPALGTAVIPALVVDAVLGFSFVAIGNEFLKTRLSDATPSVEGVIYKACLLTTPDTKSMFSSYSNFFCCRNNDAAMTVPAEHGMVTERLNAYNR